MLNLDIDSSALQDLSVYIHVPFCDSICDFCAFSKVLSEKNLITKYVDCLTKEIKQFCIKYSFDIFSETKTLYFGGGTPSTLSIDHLERILSLFNTNAIDEITIECHPDHINMSYAEQLLRMGFNRISVGIENIDGNMLTRLGRSPHNKPISEISKIFHELNFDNWSVDFMFGYSDMSLDSFSSMLDYVLDLSFPPSHLSLYALTVEPGTPLYRRSEFEMEDDLIRYYTLIENTMTQKGYQFEEISNWHKPRHGSLHNQNYWGHGDWIGFGPGAYSTVLPFRWFNTKKVKSYIDKIDSVVSPIVHVECLSKMDITLETLMLDLRTPMGIEQKYLPEVLLKDGLVVVDVVTQRYILTPKGKALCNYVCSQILL